VNRPPAITVAIPTFNGSRYIIEAVESVLAQDADARFDLIVSDDRSDDDTVEKVRGVIGDRGRIEVNTERLGLAGNWNRCVERAATDWVAVFHQDDVMRPHHLARHLGVLAHVSSQRSDGKPPGLVASPAEPIDSEGRPIDPRRIESGVIPLKSSSIDSFEKIELDIGVYVGQYEPGSLVRDLAVSNPLRCSAVTLNREAIRTIGGFDPRWRYAVDWDAWIRLGRSFASCFVWMPTTVGFRWHLESETHRFRTGTADLDEQRVLIEAVAASDIARTWPDRSRLRRDAHRRLARAYLNRAYDAARAGNRSLEFRCLKTAGRLDPGSMLRLIREPRLVARLMLGPSGRGP
jgi:glycosyltransferase involved in cell wall biosynthesis